MKSACIRFPLWLKGGSGRTYILASAIADHSPKLFAIRAPPSLELRLVQDYDHLSATSTACAHPEFLARQKRGNDDRLFRSGIRYGGEPVRCRRQSPRNPDGRARSAAAAQARDHGVLPDPSR